MKTIANAMRLVKLDILSIVRDQESRIFIRQAAPEVFIACAAVIALGAFIGYVFGG